MNKNVVIVLVGGFFIAILVAVLVQASLGGKKTDTEERTYVLVAAKNLPLGTNLSEGDLKWQAWPGQPFVGAITRKDDQKATDALTGRLAQRVESGQPVLTSYTVRQGRGNIVAATLEQGMRAVAIPVKANTMAGGFITPGDFVDVILTYRVRGGGEDTQFLVSQTASETILKNVKVLAVDQEAKRDDDAAKIARTVTLQVDTSGAEKVALASEMGDIILSLRGLGDDKVDETPSYTTDVLTNKVMQDVVAIQGGGASGKVKIYSGANVSEQKPRGADSMTGTQQNENTGANGAVEESSEGTEE